MQRCWRPRSVTVSLNAHECIVFSAQTYQSTDYAGACEEPQMFIYVNNVDASSYNFVNCDKHYNCRYSYTGPNCEYYVSTVNFCNGNGSPKRGKRTDYLGCYCDSFSSDRFCEDPNQNKYKEQGLLVKRADFKLGDLTNNDFTETLSDTTSLRTNQGDYSDYPYSIIRKEGYFYIPQTLIMNFNLKEVLGLIFYFATMNVVVQNMLI